MSLDPTRCGQVDLARAVLYLLRFMASQGVVGPAHAAGQYRTPTRRGSGLPLCALFLAACGGGAPLLHPAHVLPLNTVSFGAGVSGQFASDAAEARIDAGRLAATQSLSDPQIAKRYAEGVLSQALLAPGLSPWVGARVGLPWRTEAGLTYTGRNIRLDGRHMLALGEVWALSFGVGASALFLSPDSPDSDTPATDGSPGEAAFDLSASGWGADIPVVVGYEAVNGFLDVWAGARAGFERINGDIRPSGGDPSVRIEAEGQRWWGGALAGFSLGVAPLWLRFELATTFHQVTGQLTGETLEPDGAPAPDFGSVDVQGWSLSPSAAILGKF
jgi:hypothetical protein